MQAKGTNTFSLSGQVDFLFSCEPLGLVCRGTFLNENALNPSSSQTILSKSAEQATKKRAHTTGLQLNLKYLVYLDGA